MRQGVGKGKCPQRLRPLSRRNQYIDLKLLTDSLILLQASPVAGGFRLSLTTTLHSDNPQGPSGLQRDQVLDVLNSHGPASSDSCKFGGLVFKHFAHVDQSCICSRINCGQLFSHSKPFSICCPSNTFLSSKPNPAEEPGHQLINRSLQEGFLACDETKSTGEPWNRVKHSLLNDLEDICNFTFNLNSIKVQKTTITIAVANQIKCWWSLPGNTQDS